MNGYFGLYRGMVVNNADPENRGRLLLQVPTVTGFRQTAWAEPSHPSGFPVIAPKPGDPVWAHFVAGDTAHPVWMGVPTSTGGSGSVVSFDALDVGDLTVTSTITVPDASIPVAKISGLSSALASYETLAHAASTYAPISTTVTLNSTQTISGAKTFTSTVVAPQLEMTPSVGTARGRFGGLSGVEAWTGMFMNAQYTPSGWVLDDSTKVGWFFKLDSRSIAGGAYQEFAVYRIPAGAGYHTDEAPLFKVHSTGLVTIAGKITGLANPVGATDAVPLGFADARYYSPTNPQPVTPPSITGAMLLMGA